MTYMWEYQAHRFINWMYIYILRISITMFSGFIHVALFCFIVSHPGVCYVPGSSTLCHQNLVAFVLAGGPATKPSDRWVFYADRLVDVVNVQYVHIYQGI